MSVLSDAAILEALKSGELSIEPWNDKHLTPNGVDLTIAEILVPGEAGGQAVKSGEAVVPPMTRFLVSTAEYLRHGPTVCSQLWIRSSYARKGVLASFGKVEAGFEGTLTIGAFNASSEALRIPIGDRFCQVAFERLTGPPLKTYKERSGNYQGQRGITLARE